MSETIDTHPSSQGPTISRYDEKFITGAIEVDGKIALLGYLGSGFKGEVPTQEEGETITLQVDISDAGLLVEVVNSDGVVENSKVLTKEGESVSALGGTIIRFATSDSDACFMSSEYVEPIETIEE